VTKESSAVHDPTLAGGKLRWPLAAVAAGALLVLLLPHGRFWLFAPLFLLGPGYLIERAWAVELPPLLRPAVWVGASIAAITLFYLWLTTAGLRVTPTMIGLAALGLGLGLLWSWRDLRALPSLRGLGLPANLAVLLGLVLLLAAWTRVRHIDGLQFPPWVDSVHHALIIRVVGESGQVPYSLRPYLPIDRFVYHWGYHALAATIMHASGLDLPTTMLWLGQLLGFLQVITLAGAAVALWDRPLAGVLAGATVGFWSIMPAYFLSWGRYTLLTGLVMLPAVLVLAWHSAARFDQRRFGLLTLLLAGLLPTHFVAAGFAMLWCAAVWLGKGAWGADRWRSAAGFAVAGGLALVLVAPWLAVLIGQTANTGGPTQIQGSVYNSYQNAAGLYWTSNNRWLAALAAGGTLLALGRRWRAALVLPIWVGLVMLMANPVWLGLPYLSFFNNNIVALGLYVPFSLLIGGGAAALDALVSQEAGRRSPAALRGWRALRSGGVAALALWLGFHFTSVVNSGTLIAKSEDRAAISWAAANTPPNARFAINTDGWLYTITRGGDGGWWLLPLAGRQVSTPPVIYNYGSREYTAEVERVTNWLRDAKDKTPAELAEWMHANGFGYAYATKNGRLFNSVQLAASPLFSEVYHSDEVSIFALK